jgi:bifunctional UDP-N-acetylglucosamine pyrophosphorylase / glucosamine-1-phosphate N-acetyltransferase
MTHQQADSATAASIILAAGKGSRMLGYSGSKTLLPLIPGASRFEGEQPMLLAVLNNLPPGPKAIVVHHRAEDIRRATRGMPVSYIFQPVTNGTGGALLAAAPFLETVNADQVLITMGDVPLIRNATYQRLLERLAIDDLVLLAFAARDRAQYGMLETEEKRVRRIIEWKYWREFATTEQIRLQYCNAGVYAAKRQALLRYLEPLAKRPHFVQKQSGNEWVTIEEFFLTDLVEMMSEAGEAAGFVLVEETEVMGVDTPQTLEIAQKLYAQGALTGYGTK